LFDLKTTRQLRSYCLLPVYFRKICMKPASELCSMYSSEYCYLGFKQIKVRC
jgi:hypothetical protein